MKLTKWNLYICRWLNFWANFVRIINTKSFACFSVLFLIGFALVVGFAFKYESIQGELAFEHYMKVSTQDAKRKEIEDKVKFVMQLYHCNDFVILEAILNTKHPVLMACLIGQESEYNLLAISKKSALGLCQIMPYHFKKGQDWRNPVISIQVADVLLSEYLDYFKDKQNCESLALAAYNAGFPLVKKIGKIPDIEETKQYVMRIKNNLNKANRL